MGNYKHQIEFFLSQLNSEKKYFDINLERIRKWKVIMIAEEEQEIIAAAGLEKKFGMIRSAIIIKRELQGKGLGTLLLKELIDKTRKRYHVVWAIIAEENEASIRLHLAESFRPIGRRQNLFYLAVPLGVGGRLLVYCFSILFPFTRMIDIIRH